MLRYEQGEDFKEIKIKNRSAFKALTPTSAKRKTKITFVFAGQKGLKLLNSRRKERDARPRMLLRLEIPPTLWKFDSKKLNLDIRKSSSSLNIKSYVFFLT